VDGAGCQDSLHM